MPSQYQIDKQLDDVDIRLDELIHIQELILKERDRLIVMREEIKNGKYNY